MATQFETTSPENNARLKASQVYTMAAMCLAVGFIVGYFFLGKNAYPTMVGMPPSAAVNQTPTGKMGAHPQMTLEEIKKMADVKAPGLIEKSKADPKNAHLLIQIADIYQATHQFKEAASYFDQALKIDPKNVNARTQLASCLFYAGDADGAISQLNQALKFDPKDANALFNLGMIKYRGKNDNAGAIAAWEALLKANPNLDRKPIVEQMIADAKPAQSTKNQ